jgi:hypothetical protein
MLGKGLRYTLRTGLLALSITLCVAAPKQDFQTSERFGKSADAVVRMGYDGWVNWFCEDTRRGPSGRVEAERVYCLALHELTGPLLQKRTKEDQGFFSDVRSYFADLAKISFGIGLKLTGRGDAWSLPIAQSSTAINETLWRMLKKEKPRQPRKVSEVNDLANRIEAEVQQRRPSHLSSAQRFRGLSQRIEKHFQSRPDFEVALARSFMVDMGRLALHKPN